MLEGGPGSGSGKIMQRKSLEGQEDGTRGDPSGEGRGHKPGVFGPTLGAAVTASRFLNKELSVSFGSRCWGWGLFQHQF